MAETERKAAMRDLLAEYKKSGLRRRAFCQQRGIPLTTFDYWRRELGTKAKAPLGESRCGGSRTGNPLQPDTGQRAAH